MMTPEQCKGYGAELLVASAMATQGLIISFPTRPAVYDLVADFAGQLYRVQVKRAELKKQRMTETWRRDRECYRVGLWSYVGDKKVPYQVHAFDYLAVVCDGDIYVIPSGELESPENPGYMTLVVQIKPMVEGLTRKDAIAAGLRFERYRNNFALSDRIRFSARRFKAKPTESE